MATRQSKMSGSLSRVAGATGSLPTVSALVSEVQSPRNLKFAGAFLPIGQDIPLRDELNSARAISKERLDAPIGLEVVKEKLFVARAFVNVSKLALLINKSKMPINANVLLDVSEFNGENVEVLVRARSADDLERFFLGLVDRFEYADDSIEHGFVILGIEGQTSWVMPETELKEYYYNDSESEVEIDVLDVSFEVLPRSQLVSRVVRPALILPIADIFPEELEPQDLKLHLEKLNRNAGLAPVLNSNVIRAKIVGYNLYLCAAAERVSVDLLRIATDLQSVLPHARINLGEVTMMQIQNQFVIESAGELNGLPGDITLRPNIYNRLSGRAHNSRDYQHLKHLDASEVEGGFRLNGYKIRPTLRSYPVSGEEHNKVLEDLVGIISYSDKRTCSLHGQAGIGKSTVIANAAERLPDVDFYVASYRHFNRSVPGASLRDIFSEICDAVEDILKKALPSDFEKSRVLVANFRQLDSEAQRFQFQRNAVYYIDQIATLLEEIDDYYVKQGSKSVFVFEDFHFSDNFSRANIISAIEKFKKRRKDQVPYGLKFLLTSRDPLDIDFIEWNGGLKEIQFTRQGIASQSEVGFKVGEQQYIVNEVVVSSFVNNYFEAKVSPDLGFSDFMTVDVLSFGRLFHFGKGNPAYTNDLIEIALAKNAIVLTDGTLSVSEEYLRVLAVRGGVSTTSTTLAEVYVERFGDLTNEAKKALLIVNLIQEVSIQDLFYIVRELGFACTNSFNDFLENYLDPLTAVGYLQHDVKGRVVIARPDYAEAVDNYFDVSTKSQLARNTFLVAGHVLSADVILRLRVEYLKGCRIEDFGSDDEADSNLHELSLIIESLYDRNQFSLLARSLFASPVTNQVLDRVRNGHKDGLSPLLIDFAIKSLAYGVTGFVVTSDFEAAKNLINKYGEVMRTKSISDHIFKKYAPAYFGGEFMYYYFEIADKKGPERQAIIEKMEANLRISNVIGANSLSFVYYLYRYNKEAQAMPEDIFGAINLRLSNAGLTLLRKDQNTREYIDATFKDSVSLRRFCGLDSTSSDFDSATLNEGVRLVARNSVERAQNQIDDVSGMDDRVSYLCTDDSLFLTRLSASGRSMLLDEILKAALKRPASVMGSTLVDFLAVKLEAETIAINPSSPDAAERYAELSKRYMAEMFETASSVGNVKQSVVACNMAARCTWMGLVAKSEISEEGKFVLDVSGLERLLNIKAVEFRTAQRLLNSALDKRIAYQDFIYYLANFVEGNDMSTEVDINVKKTFLKALIMLYGVFDEIISKDAESAIPLVSVGAYKDWPLLQVITRSLVAFDAANRRSMQNWLAELGVEAAFVTSFRLKSNEVIRKLDDVQKVDKAYDELYAYKVDPDGMVALRKRSVGALKKAS